MGPWESTSIHEHPVRCTGRNLSWVHVRARACTSSHEHPVRCTGMNCSLVRGRARPSTSILCAAQVGRGLQEDAREAIQVRFTNSVLVSVLPKSGRTEKPSAKFWGCHVGLSEGVEAGSTCENSRICRTCGTRGTCGTSWTSGTCGACGTCESCGICGACGTCAIGLSAWGLGRIISTWHAHCMARTLQCRGAWCWRESQRALLAGLAQERQCSSQVSAGRSCNTLVSTSCPLFAWAGRPRGADLT